MMNPQDLDALAGMYEGAGSLQLKEIEQRYKLGKDSLKNAMKIAQMESGDRRYGIDASRETQLASIAQAREEMLRIGIPRVEIEKWVAEKNYEIANNELTFKREQWEDQLGLQRGALTGYYNGDPTLAREEQQFRQGIDEGTLTGEYGGQQTLAGRRFGLDEQEQNRRFGLDVGRETGYVNGQQTLDRERLGYDAQEQARRYGLDVAKFGAELSSTPDTYFQAQRFMANDLPQLQGMAGGPMPAGGPTAGVARMGQLLGPGAQASAPGAPAPQGAPLSPQEQARYAQLMARQTELGRAGAGGLGPEDQAELARYAARGDAPGGGQPGQPGNPLSPQEQARYAQIMARRAEIAAAGGGDVGPEDQAELAGYEARGAGPPAATLAGGGAQTGWAPPGGWRPGDNDQQQMISDPGWRPPQGDPAAARLRAMGGYRPPEPMMYAGGGGAFNEHTGRYAGGTPGGGIEGAGTGSFADSRAGAAGGYRPPEPMRYPTGSSPYGGSGVGSSAYRPQPYGGSGAASPRGMLPGGGMREGGGSAGTSATQDPRTRQISQIARAAPPSPYDGLNDTDSAALRLMESIYKQGGRSLDPAAYSRLKAQKRTGFLSSAGRTLGYDPNDLDSEFQAYRPTQSSASLA